MKNKMDLFSHRIESRKRERKRKTRKKESLPKPAVETAGYYRLPL